MNTNKDFWDKFKIIVYAVGVIGFIFVGNWITASIKEKERETKMVSLAIDVLANEPTKDSIPLRKWAVKVVNKYSEIELDERAINYLLKHRITSSGGLRWNDPGVVKDRNLYKFKSTPNN